MAQDVRPRLALQTGPCVAGLGLSPDLPDAKAHAQGVGLCHALRGIVWHWLSEKALGLLWGQLPSSYSEWLPPPPPLAGPEPSLRQLPAWHPLEGEEAGGLRKQGLGSEKPFVFSWFLHKQPLSARPQGQRETRPLLVW